MSKWTYNIVTYHNIPPQSLGLPSCSHRYGNFMNFHGIKLCKKVRKVFLGWYRLMFYVLFRSYSPGFPLFGCCYGDCLYMSLSWLSYSGLSGLYFLVMNQFRSTGRSSFFLKSDKAWRGTSQAERFGQVPDTERGKGRGLVDFSGQ